MKRVVVTGLGAITPAGLSVAETWDNLVAGRTAISRIEGLPAGKISVSIAAQIKNFDPAAYFSKKQRGRMDRVSHFAVAAAREAILNSGLALTEEIAREAIVIVGVAAGGMNTLDDSFHSIYADDRNQLHPMTIPRLMVSAPASQVSMDLGIQGMSYAVASACASGTHAVGLAFRAIRSGESRVAITGGAEACITTGALLGWEALRILSFDTCRPFSKDRSGLVLGEGSAMLVLEELEHAEARGAHIYAEIVGFGANADAGDLTSPDMQNIARAMQSALLEAGLAPADVGYVNAHGTGTLMNDLVESSAIKSVFDGASLPLVSSIKGVLGHSLGAAGAIEAMATILTLHHQTVPPTANFTQADPEIGLDVVATGARHVNLNCALTNSFAFGGLNAVLALQRYQPSKSSFRPARIA